MMEEIEGPIIKIVNGILIKAIKLGASDIHFEPYEKTFRVRYRIDGVLMRAMALPIQIKNAVVSRLKIMASLDIAERRLPQDGRIKLRLGKSREMDFRVSTIPDPRLAKRSSFVCSTSQPFNWTCPNWGLRNRPWRI